MYDESPDDIGVFDFDEFASHLLDQGVQASPSLLHGCLSGLLCAGAEAEPEFGLDALSRALDFDVHGELASRIMQLYTVSLLALQSEEFVFLPLLPADDEDIELRTASLASWCEGCITGFAYGAAAQGGDRAAFSEETSEVLRDLAAIAEAVTGEEDSEEEVEESYTELVEFIRVAVVNVFMDCVAGSREELAPDPDRPLH